MHSYEYKHGEGDTHCPSLPHIAIHLSPTFQVRFGGGFSEVLEFEDPSVGCELSRSFVSSITSCKKKERETKKRFS